LAILFKHLRNLSKIGIYTTQKPLAFLGFENIYNLPKVIIHPPKKVI
jgi:hypothetical protein